MCSCDMVYWGSLLSIQRHVKLPPSLVSRAADFKLCNLKQGTSKVNPSRCILNLELCAPLYEKHFFHDTEC